MEFIHSLLESIGFNWHVALANFINFLIILFVLNKFVFGKVVNMVKERDATIKKGLDNASHAEQALKTAKADAEKVKHDAKEEAEKTLHAAIDKSKEESERLIKNSKQNILDLENNLKEKISETEENVTREFAAYAPTLIAELLKKTLSKTLTKEEHDLIVLELVKK